MNWTSYRRPDGSIDLAAAFVTIAPPAMTEAELGLLDDYFATIDQMHPIHSRQVAIVALTTARSLVLLRRGATH